MQVKGKLVRRVDERMNIIKATGCTLESDGWSNTKRQPLINFLLSTPNGSKFLRTVTSDAKKNARFLADEFAKVIREVGPERVVSIITDSASVNKSAWDHLKQDFNNVTWVRCSAHAVNLILRDMGELKWIEGRVQEARQLVTFIRNHHGSLALYRRFVSSLPQLSPGHGKELLMPAHTRFGTNVLMCGRLVEVKEALQNMVRDPDWSKWVSDRSKPADRDKAFDLSIIVRDDGCWKDVQRFVDICTPVMSLLRMVDTSKPIMGEVYPAFSKVAKLLETAVYSDSALEQVVRRNEVVKIFSDRWNWCHSPMHACGYILNPKYHSVWGELAGEARREDRVGKTPRGCTTFHELTTGRKKMFYRLLGHDKARVLKAYKEFGDYSKMRGCIDPVVWDLAAEKDMVPWEWWEQHGAAWPTLRIVAMRVLAQPSSASSCERNWSTYEFIHNRRRNRLTMERADDLVFVFSNLRLVATAVDPDACHRVAGAEVIRDSWDLKEDADFREGESDMEPDDDPDLDDLEPNSGSGNEALSESEAGEGDETEDELDGSNGRDDEDDDEDADEDENGDDGDDGDGAGDFASSSDDGDGD
eukprot:356537-Chlamydomonas_euryale.AAC.1